MRRKKAEEIASRLAMVDDQSDETRNLVYSSVFGNMSRWDSVTYFFWDAIKYLNPRYPHLWKLGIKLMYWPFYVLIHDTYYRKQKNGRL